MRILRAIVEPTADLLASGVADLSHRRGISAQPVGDDRPRLAVFLHDPLEKLQRRSLVPLRGDHRLQHLAFMVDGAPQIAELAVDLHERLIQMPCMDAPARARWFRIVWSRDRVRSCIRPSGAACHDRWPVWRCADEAQNQRRELLSSMAFYCISWPGSDRSFALTVPRPPHTPDVPLAAQPDRGSGGRSHGTSIIFPLCQHGPD